MWFVSRLYAYVFVSVGPHINTVTKKNKVLLVVPKGFNTFLAKEFNFVVPICDGPFPVGVSALPALLVNVQILSDHKTSCEKCEDERIMRIIIL